MHRVICAGHVNWDVTLQVDTLPEADGEAVIGEQFQGGGGSASNTATVLSCLECSPTLLGSVGTDEYGELTTDELSEVGVDCSYIQSVPGETTVKYLIVDEAGQVMVLGNDGVNEQFSGDDLPVSQLEATRWLHLTSQKPETALALATRAKEAGVPVSFDPGRRLDKREFEGIVECADIVFFNDREAKLAQRQELVKRDETVTVTKEGNGGATAKLPDETVTHDGYDVTPVDTAGAGDAFAAGFLAARFEGATIHEGLAVGNACGAIAVQHVGARTAVSWSDIEQYCKTSF